MILEDISKNRDNNLNLIRFIAAIMVIFCHAYPLSVNGLDPLGRLTNGQIHFGALAVYTFFFFGGFWINRSIHRSKSLYSFFKARCMRIFPCLIITVFFCAFCMGSIITTLSLRDYFTNIQTYEYLLNSLLILRHNLPGVFENNIYNATVNGSLWTLPVEFLCYIGCYLVWRLGLSEEKTMKYTIPVFVIGYLLLYICLLQNPLLRSALGPGAMFYFGMLCDVYRKHISIKPAYVSICIIGLILSIFWGNLKYGLFLFWPYILLWLAFGVKKKWSSFGKKHEFSYAIYLCAFPIQQLVTMLFGGSMDPIANFLISLPCILLVGWLLTIFVDSIFY